MKNAKILVESLNQVFLNALTEINNIVAKIPGWERLKTPRKFDGYGQQRGFRKIAMKTTEEESENSEFVVVSEQEQMELPFD